MIDKVQCKISFRLSDYSCEESDQSNTMYNLTWAVKLCLVKIVPK